MGVRKFLLFVLVLCVLTFEVKLNWDRRQCHELEQDCLEEFFMILTEVQNVRLQSTGCLH